MTNPNPEARIFAVVAAAGVGKRMGSPIAKQYLPLQGKPLLFHALQPLLNWPRLDSLTLVLHPDDPHRAAIQQQFPSVSLVTGGSERADSVLAGLQSLQGLARDDDWVLVHDAARPCLTQVDLDGLWTQLAMDAVGGLLAMPVRDTMKRSHQGRVCQTVAREDLWHALTPQLFRFGLLYRALSQALAQHNTITDEASAIEGLGLQPRLVVGRFDNLKVTHPEDVPLAELYLQAQRQQGLR